MDNHKRFDEIHEFQPRYVLKQGYFELNRNPTKQKTDTHLINKVDLKWYHSSK